jgi:hypothetical protein
VSTLTVFGQQLCTGFTFIFPYPVVNIDDNLVDPYGEILRSSTPPDHLILGNRWLKMSVPSRTLKSQVGMC